MIYTIKSYPNTFTDYHILINDIYYQIISKKKNTDSSIQNNEIKKKFTLYQQLF